jgi:hypothetical protein
MTNTGFDIWQRLSLILFRLLLVILPVMALADMAYGGEAWRPWFG